MGFREDMIGVGDDVYREVLGPTGLDLTPSQLTINVYTWTPPAGQPPRVGSGTRALTSTLTLGQYYPMRTLSAREIASSGGRFREGAILVEDISPPGVDADGSAVGFTPEQLAPRGSIGSVNGVEVIYTVTGQLAGDYALAETDFSDWQYFTLKLNRKRTTP